MLTRNEAPGGFVNGDIGSVVGFRLPTVEEVQEVAGTPMDFLAGEAAVLYPIVRFHRANRLGACERLLCPCNFTRRLCRVGLCLRRRLPLRLAWAFTVHKSQGMSLPLVQVNAVACWWQPQWLWRLLAPHLNLYACHAGRAVGRVRRGPGVRCFEPCDVCPRAVRQEL